MTGRVTARLPGSVAGVPVRLSFAHTTGRLLDTAFVGPVAPGTVRVEARNRIESPVVIDEQHPTPAESTPAATATPVAARPVTVAPGAAVPLDFAITPADAAVTGLDPLLSLEITPDTRALLTGAMKNEGWAGDTYAVTISTDPAYFGAVPPGGTAPLTGLRVDLVPGTSVVLTADAPSTTAHLRMPLLDWLLRDTAATRFTYRVVNLHGSADGAASPALTGTGPGTLDVIPVGA
ncbi:hypothetical protein ACFQV2_20745 [Actinokineospora soli]|uniref:Uncharacterized protein n=1 Tax=Actinokineospora soli TaxID=1048753 RepID=A0ABW2TQV3_9PSEU